MPLGKILFSFDGHITRRTFWAVWSGTVALGLILTSGLSSVVESAYFYDEKTSRFVFGISGYFALASFVLFMAAACWVMLAINAKRWPGVESTSYKALFGFRGRIGREMLWTVFLSIFMLVDFLGTVVHYTPGDKLVSVFSVWVFVAFVIAALWVGIAIQVQRLHDRNNSGLMLLYWLVPIFGMFIVFVHLGCLKGTTGPNEYGDDPLQNPLPAGVDV